MLPRLLARLFSEFCVLGNGDRRTAATFYYKQTFLFVFKFLYPNILPHLSICARRRVFRVVVGKVAYRQTSRKNERHKCPTHPPFFFFGSSRISGYYLRSPPPPAGTTCRHFLPVVRGTVRSRLTILIVKV